MTDVGLWDGWNAAGGPRYPHAKVIQFCLRNYPTAERHRVRSLDLGCGSGVNTRFLAEQGFATWAADISSVGIDNTRKLLAQHGLSAECAVAPVDALPFPDASFELVLCVGVLDSAGPAAAAGALREIHRVLHPDGRALLVFASDADLRVGAATPFGLTGYRHEDVVELVAGFRQADIDRYVTTYGGGTTQHNDFLVTLTR